MASTIYMAPIALTQNTTLRYFAVDDAGVAEAPKAAST